MSNTTNKVVMPASVLASYTKVSVDLRDFVVYVSFAVK